MNTKKYHLMIGLLLMLFGFVCTGFSIYIYFKPEVTPDLNAMLNKKVEECKNEIINQGFTVEEKRKGSVIDSITVYAKEGYILNNPMPYVYKASLVLSKCPNLQVKNFCVGEGCIAEFGKDFVFTLDRPTIKKK